MHTTPHHTPPPPPPPPPPTPPTPPTPRDYKTSLSLLLSQQSQTKSSLLLSSARRTHTVSEMRTYMQRLDLPYRNIPKHHPFSKLIHITGTKGKGSTASFTESILRRVYRYDTGFVSSPHLIHVNERIRLNGMPVSDEVFAEAYFAVRERLIISNNNNQTTNRRNSNDEGELLPVVVLPGYFRMLTLVALWIFANYEFSHKKGVDVVILEVGLGGRYDATNVFSKMEQTTFVCGVTLVDYDHERVLGETLEEIAWEKGGIFGDGDDTTSTTETSKESENKDDVKRFFTIEDNNRGGVMDVLRNCLKERKSPLEEHLEVVKLGQRIDSSWKLGIEGDHQRINAELAIAMCESLVHQDSSSDKRQTAATNNGCCSLQQALEETVWPGRCHTLSFANNIRVHCDGAHTERSLVACMKWFQRVSCCETQQHSKREMERVLIFNCSHERNPVPLLLHLFQSDFFTTRIYFCRADSERPSMVGKPSSNQLLNEAGITTSGGSNDTTAEEGTTWQDTLACIWKTFQSQSRTANHCAVVSNLNVKQAFEEIQRYADCKGDDCLIHVCVTGSLYIVGSALNACDWKEEYASGRLVLKH